MGTEKLFDIREELKKLPDHPGVYIMHDDRDAIIYIGKAISLKNRVRQYFQSSRNKGPKIEKMLGYTNMDSEKGFLFFQKFLREQGILKELEEQGIQDGDTVRMYYNEFDYYK